jgi:hypothetical protein
MPLLAFFGSILFCVPLTSAFLAKKMGRSFWRWFAMGCVLPFISVFILLLLPEAKPASTAA